MEWKADSNETPEDIVEKIAEEVKVEALNEDEEEFSNDAGETTDEFTF